MRQYDEFSCFCGNHRGYSPITGEFRELHSLVKDVNGMKIFYSTFTFTWGGGGGGRKEDKSISN